MYDETYIVLEGENVLVGNGDGKLVSVVDSAAFGDVIT